jgi:alkylation response protein AidB-like acyl-CoA dehydrogenase
MAIRDSLDLSQEQRALQESVRTFLAEKVSPGELHLALDSQPGYGPELHARLISELGLAGLTIPEEFGGLGLSQAEAGVVHTELGRALYPGPLLPGALAATALLTATNNEAGEHWLPLIANGSVNATMAAANEAGLWTPGPDSIQAEHAIDGWRLTGRRWYAIAAHVADIVIVPAITPAGSAMFLVKPGSAGFTVSRQLSLDLTRRISVTTLESTPALLLSEYQAATASLARAEQELLLANATEAAGGIAWCLDATIAYAQDREQAENPAGSFQAVANSVVDMIADLRNVSASTRYAAVATADAVDDAPEAARTAALRAAESYRNATEATVQLLGGLGSPREQDAYLHYRRAWSTQQLLGGPLADRAADQQ